MEDFRRVDGGVHVLGEVVLLAELLGAGGAGPALQGCVVSDGGN